MADVQNALTSLVGASTLTSKAIINSPMDQWGNVKIPRLDELEFPAKTAGNPWVPIEEKSDRTWVSLSGLMLKDIPIHGVSSFVLESSYIDIACSDVIQIPYINTTKSRREIDWRASFEAAQVHLNGNNMTDPFQRGPDIHYWSSFFIDTTSEAYTTYETPQNIMYGSVARTFPSSGDALSSYGNGNTSLELYNCSFTSPRIEANVTCDGRSCKVTHMRRSVKDLTSPVHPPLAHEELRNLLTGMPISLGSPTFSVPNPVDQYMLGSDSPLSLGIAPFAPGYSKITGANFSKRLTTYINTLWQASLSPYSIALGASADFTPVNYTARGSAVYVPSANTTAFTRTVLDNARYSANRFHAFFLLAITVVLQACAVAGLFLKVTTKAPDLLGYVSTMTRDNVYSSVPPGGNVMDGVERARCLADMKVKLADVRPTEDVGHIVFCNVAEQSGFDSGCLNKKKYYF